VRSGVRATPFVVNVMGVTSSQSVELDALRKRRMEDRYGVAHTRPSGSRLGGYPC